MCHCEPAAAGVAISWYCVSIIRCVLILPKTLSCVILSGAAVGSAVEESYAYQLFVTGKILRRASLAQDDTFGRLFYILKAF